MFKYSIITCRQVRIFPVRKFICYACVRNSVKYKLSISMIQNIYVYEFRISDTICFHVLIFIYESEI